MSEIEQLGKYKIDAHLGAGAYADVYKATDTTLDRVVALKVLKPTLLADSESFQRFLQEAKTLANLMHPHIAWVWDLGKAEGRYFIAMRYVDGVALDQHLAENGPLSWDEALQIAQHVADALHFAHEKNLIHRDVKPGNILISASDGAVLTDFGLVKALHASSLTATGSFLGTPHYMAPEIWKGDDVSQATDQYALACVLTEMLTGQVLYAGKTPPAVMAKHFQPPPLPGNWPLDVEPGIGNPLRRALSQNPAERFSSVLEFTHQLSATPVPSVETGKPKITPRRGVSAAGDPESMALSIGGGKLLSVVDLTFVRVPAGPFLMGSKATDEYTSDDEQPQHEVHLGEYWMGKTPVTVSQFEIFVNATGYKTTAEKEDQDKTWKHDVGGKADHPVVHVSWYDAVAFCEWASRESGHEIRLPTEAEWEKDARGSDGRTWPWGDQAPDEKRCNFTHIGGGTSSVGQYSPAGNSPYSCADMAGNVREWTNSLYKDYPYQARDGRETVYSNESRILRGGCWFSSGGGVRSAYREGGSPDITWDFNGFRCARSVSQKQSEGSSSS